MKLYMIMIGCRPKGRLTEQHDIFFGIAETLKELIPEIKKFWPEAKGQFHIDAWRTVTYVDDYKIEVVPKNADLKNDLTLFFINLGGYQPGSFEEFHFKTLHVANSLSEATQKAKNNSFYKNFGFKGAVSHIDDKFGIDVDEIHKVQEILSPLFTEKFQLKITSEANWSDDELHIGYLKIDKIP